MLGRYLHTLLGRDHEVTTLQRADADICCDLRVATPTLAGRKFDLVVHAAGTQEEAEALSVNRDGTIHLLAALEENPPRGLVFVSSWEVYSPDSGENVGEEHQLWASTKVGQSKALAEGLAAEWCKRYGVVLTIVRPARMFGKGVKGEMASLFSDVAASRYIHVRDNDARLSLICASDVAEAIAGLHHAGGIYNLTDGRDARWIELADALSANCGLSKRQIFLPEKWAQAAWRYARWVPAVKASLSPATLARRSKTLTLSTEKITAALPAWHPYKAIDVIARKDKDYPYEDR